MLPGFFPRGDRSYQFLRYFFLEICNVVWMVAFHTLFPVTHLPWQSSGPARVDLIPFDYVVFPCIISKVSFCFGLPLVDIPGSSDGKEYFYSAEDLGSIPGLGRSPGGGNGNPLKYSGLENPIDSGAWRLLSMGLQRVGHDWATNTFHLLMEREIYIYSCDLFKLKEL